MIVVNGRFLLKTETGVERFAGNVLRELLRLREDLHVVTPRSSLPVPFAAERIGAFQGHSWEQLDLPRYLSRRGSPLLLNLASTGPSLYRRQIITHHDVAYIRHPDSFTRRFRWLYRAIVPPALHRARRVVTVSEFSRGEISGHYGIAAEKISVVHNAVGEPFTGGEAPAASGAATGPGTASGAAAASGAGSGVRSGLAASVGEPYFLAVSSPSRHKNFERLVEAFAACRDLETRRLVIVGESSRSFPASARWEALRRTASETGIIFTGRVDDEELVALYRGARAFVFPSLYEGFGIPPLEAQACGTPVIASRAASLPEVLGDSVLYVDPSSTEDIAAALRTVEDDDVRRRLIAAGSANVQRFSWADSARRLSSILDEALEAP